MSRAQWGHGFHTGKIAGISDALTINQEDTLYAWIGDLRKGEKVARADWSPDCWGEKHLFVKDGQLYLYDLGSIEPYKITQEDLSCDEWFGIAEI